MSHNTAQWMRQQGLYPDSMEPPPEAYSNTAKFMRDAIGHGPRAEVRTAEVRTAQAPRTPPKETNTARWMRQTLGNYSIPAWDPPPVMSNTAKWMRELGRAAAAEEAGPAGSTAGLSELVEEAEEDGLAVVTKGPTAEDSLLGQIERDGEVAVAVAVLQEMDELTTHGRAVNRNSSELSALGTAREVPPRGGGGPSASPGAVAGSMGVKGENQGLGKTGRAYSGPALEATRTVFSGDI